MHTHHNSRPARTTGGAHFRRRIAQRAVIPGGIIRSMPMTLRLTTQETEALRETAQREHRSMQDVARTAIDEYVTRRSRHRAAYLAAIVREDAELLRRLGGA